MRKLLTVILTVCLVSASCISTFAANDREIFDVVSLGIMEGDETGDLRLESELTRAEFAQIVLRLLNVPEEGLQTGLEERFNDVTAGQWYAPAVNYIAALGYINGYPDGTFRPDENVLIQDVMKILVSVLGYDISAEESGGYPMGYITEAARLKVSSGINRGAEEFALRDDVLRMVYNALDVEILQKQYTGTEEEIYEIAEGDTLRGRLTDTADVYHVKGIVTADNNTYLLESNTDFEPDEIEIDGVIYRATGIDASQYIGQEVECYYYENEHTGEREIRSIAPTIKNEIVTFDAELFSSYGNGTVEYYPDENSAKVKQLTLSSGCVIVYNNRILREVTDSDFKVGYGSYRLIDNSGDGKFDYLFIESEETVVVDSVFETGEIYFKNTFTVNGARYISVDPEETQSYSVVDQEGNALALTDIQPGSVLTVQVSKDSTYVKFILSTDVREVTVSRMKDNEILIDGQWHDVINPNLDIETGALVTGYFDYRGGLVYVTDADVSNTSEKYGYVVKVSEGEGFGEPVVLLLSAGTVTNREEANKENLDDKNTIPTLYCANETVQEVSLSGKVRVNGVSKNSSDMSRMELDTLIGPVIYSMDSNGKLKSLETPELVGGVPGQEINYSAREMVFGGSVSLGGFGIDENTKVCCVPDDSSASMEDYLVEVKIDNRDSAQKFNAQGYILDETTNNVKFLVLTRPMSTDTVTSINYRSSNVGVVTEMATAVDENGEEYYITTILSASGEVTYETKGLTDGNQVLATLTAGDLIYYELDNDDRLQNARVIVNIPDGINTSDYWDEATENEALYGLVTEMDLDIIDVVNTRRADILKIQAGNSLEEIYVPTRNAPVVFLYEENLEKYSVTTTANIREGVDNVYVLQPYGSPKLLVIKR